MYVDPKILGNQVHRKKVELQELYKCLRYFFWFFILDACVTTIGFIYYYFMYPKGNGWIDAWTIINIVLAILRLFVLVKLHKTAKSETPNCGLESVDMKMWMFIFLWIGSWIGTTYLIRNRTDVLQVRMKRGLYLGMAIGILLFGFFIYYMHKFFDHLKKYIHDFEYLDVRDYPAYYNYHI